MNREKSGHLPGLGLQRRALRTRRPWAWPPVERCIETQLYPASRTRQLSTRHIAQAEFPTRMFVHFGTYKIRQGDKDRRRQGDCVSSPRLFCSLSPGLLVCSVSVNYPADSAKNLPGSSMGGSVLFS